MAAAPLVLLRVSPRPLGNRDHQTDEVVGLGVVRDGVASVPSSPPRMAELTCRC